MNDLVKGLKKTPIILNVVFIFLIVACVNNKYDWDKLSDEIKLEARFAAPLIKGSLSLEDIIQDISSENVGKFPDDSLIYLVYSDTFKSYASTDVVNIPNQTFLESFINSDISSIPEWTGSGIGDTVEFIKQKNGIFNVSHNEKIDSIKVKSANLKIKVTSSFLHKGILHVHSNSIKRNRQPFMHAIQISSSSGTFSTSIDIPLNNAVINLNNSNPSVSILPFTLELFLINSGAPILLGQKCNISISIENMQFSSIFGYLGSYNLIAGNGQFDLSIYDEIIGDGHMLFADPRFVILSENSFGIPVEINFSNVSAYSEKNNLTTPITFSGGNPFDINYPVLSLIGKYAKDSIVIKKEQCNILLAMGTYPNYLRFDIAAKTNPAGPSGPYNFITDSSRLNTAFEIILPLWFMGKNIVLEDTTDFDLEKEMDDFFDYLNYLRITLEGTNGFPLEASLQVFLTNSSYTVLDSLFSGNSMILDPAPVNTNGQARNGVKYKRMAEFSKEKLTRIKNTKHLIIKATLNSTNAASGQFVRFYSYNTINFKMSIKTNLAIN